MSRKYCRISVEKGAKNTGKLVNQLVCNDLKGLCGRMEKLSVAHSRLIRYDKVLSNAVLNDILFWPGRTDTWQTGEVGGTGPDLLWKEKWPNSRCL